MNRPKVLMGQHPIETGNYHLPTKEIIKLSTVIESWIKNRSPGAIVYGRPRLGKTRAIGYIKHYLKSEFGEELPIFTMYCSEHKPTENNFYTDLLRDIGHSAYDKGKADVKKNRLIKYFIQCAESSGHRKIILFVDEAQMLYEQDYNWLMYIYNQLDRYAITMTVILVGQDELFHQKEAFISLNKRQITGRFMVHTYKFSGIKTKDDLQVCLEGYDEHSEYPVGSGWSFTRYFFTNGYDDGKRLKDDAEMIYSRFDAVRKNANSTGKLEIPMQYITLTVDYCMKQFGVSGTNQYWPTASDWDEAIRYSGYIDLEIYNSQFK